MAQRPPEFPDEQNDEPVSGTARYLAVWAVMACVAALYLAAVSIRPAFLDGILPSGGASAEAAAQTTADIVNIRDSIGQLQTDVVKTQTDLAHQSDTTRTLSERVAALEQKGHPAEAQGAPAGEPQRTGAAQSDSGTDFEFPSGNAAPVKAAEAKPSKQPKVINGPIETGSVAEDGSVAAPAAAPAKPKPAADKVAAFSEPKVKKAVGIKLATGASVDNLRVSWGILSERHSAELKPLQPRYFNTVDGNGITYELVAGPFKTTADAKKVCQSLQAQAIDCQVSSYGGNSL
jgi:hypothetical protein